MRMSDSLCIIPGKFFSEQRTRMEYIEGSEAADCSAALCCFGHSPVSAEKLN
jgi:hypothetical protein